MLSLILALAHPFTDTLFFDGILAWLSDPIHMDWVLKGVAQNQGRDVKWIRFMEMMSLSVASQIYNAWSGNTVPDEDLVSKDAILLHMIRNRVITLANMRQDAFLFGANLFSRQHISLLFDLMTGDVAETARMTIGYMRVAAPQMGPDAIERWAIELVRHGLLRDSIHSDRLLKLCPTAAFCDEFIARYGASVCHNPLTFSYMQLSTNRNAEAIFNCMLYLVAAISTTTVFVDYYMDGFERVYSIDYGSSQLVEIRDASDTAPFLEMGPVSHFEICSRFNDLLLRHYTYLHVIPPMASIRGSLADTMRRARHHPSARSLLPFSPAHKIERDILITAHTYNSIPMSHHLPDELMHLIVGFIVLDSPLMMI